MRQTPTAKTTFERQFMSRCDANDALMALKAQRGVFCSTNQK